MLTNFIYYVIEQGTNLDDASNTTFSPIFDKNLPAAVDHGGVRKCDCVFFKDNKKKIPF